MDAQHPPVVLSIAASDSSGGGGIQADIKTITAHRLYAETAITAVLAQNTLGVHAVESLSPATIAAQIDACFSDIRPAAVRIGMMRTPEIVETVAERLGYWSAENIVVDPVIVTATGGREVADEAIDALKARLFPLAAVVTPNITEAQIILGYEIDSERTQQNAAMLIAARYGCASLVKGGRLTEQADDVLAEPAPLDDDGKPMGDPLTTWFHHKRIETANTHGAGCTLSSAIACSLASGMTLPDAVNTGKAYVTGALAGGLDLGQGAGPVNHMWAM